MTPSSLVSKEVMRDALMRAGGALSDLLERKFEVSEITLSHCEPAELPGILGDEAMPVCASFFQVRGEIPGFLLLIMPLGEVETFLEPLLGDAPADHEMADSAFGEVGNVVGSSFLNYIADYYHTYAAPTPPQVFRDMIGALMGSLAAVFVEEGDCKVPIVRTVFTQATGRSAALLLWIPYELSLADLRRSP